MPKKAIATHQAEAVTTLHGPNAFRDLEMVIDKLRRAGSMASVLNHSAFAVDVELPREDFQDFTTDLAALLQETRSLVAKFVMAKEVA